MPQEVGLAKMDIDGKMYNVLFPGERSGVPMPLGSQPIAHTHPTKNSMQRWPSNADMRFINNYHFNYQLILNPSSPPKPHTIIWGDSPG